VPLPLWGGKGRRGREEGRGTRLREIGKKNCLIPDFWITTKAGGGRAMTITPEEWGGGKHPKGLSCWGSDRRRGRGRRLIFGG